MPDNSSDRSEGLLVSVVMPAYNASRTIERSMESVLRQTYRNIELLVVDDDSQDSTLEIVSRFSRLDSRLKIFRTSGRLGAAGARNVATAAAEGVLIAFCDSDDVWHVDKLTRQVAFMSQINSSLCGTAFERIDERDRIVSRKIPIPRRIELKDLLKRNSLCCASVLYDARKLGKLFMPDYRQGLKVPIYLNWFGKPPLHEDFLTWIQVLSRDSSQLCADGLDEVLVSYRVASGSHSANKIASALARWHIYRNVLHLSFADSVWFMSNYAISSLLLRLFR